MFKYVNATLKSLEGHVMVSWDVTDPYAVKDVKFAVITEYVPGAGCEVTPVNPEWREIPVDGLVRSYELKDVKSWKSLKVTVRGTENLLNVDYMSTTVDTHETVPTGQVTNIKALSTQPTSAQLTWDPPPCELRGGRLKNYVVQVAPVRDPNKMSIYQPITESQMANNLEPYTEYKVVVRYVNYRGEGPDSDPLFFNTSQGPPSAPMIYNFTFDDSSIGLVIVQPLQPRGQIDQYHLQLTGDMLGTSDLFTAVNGTEYIIGRLQSNTTYNIRVRAHNAAGWGEWSRLISVTTKDEFRPVAKAIIQDLANASCVGFHWLAPPDQTNVINSYKIRVEKVGDVQASQESMVPKSTLSFIQCGLHAYAEYEVTVRIIKDNGQSGQALAARMWTEGLVPPKPRQPIIRKTTSTTVTVEIYPVTFEDGPLSTYEIRVLELQHNHTSLEPHTFDPSKEPMLQDLLPRPSSYVEADKTDKPTLNTASPVPSPPDVTPRPQQDNGPYFRPVRKRSTRPKSSFKLVIIPAPGSIDAHGSNISTWFESWRLQWLYESQIRWGRPRTEDCPRPKARNCGRATPIQPRGSGLFGMNGSTSSKLHHYFRPCRSSQGCGTLTLKKSGSDTRTAREVRSVRLRRQTSGLPGALWMELPAYSLTEPTSVIVGDNSANNGKPNIPLKPETEYVIVHVVKSTVVDVTKHAYSYSSSTAFTGKPETPQEEEKEEDDDKLWYWLIILACVILVVLLCVLCFCLISYLLGRREESAAASKGNPDPEADGSEEDNTDEDSVDYDQRPLKGIDEDGAPTPMRHTDDLESYFNPVHSLGQPRYINTMRDNVMYSDNHNVSHVEYSDNYNSSYTGRHRSPGYVNMLSDRGGNNDNNSAILAAGVTSNVTSNNNLLLQRVPVRPNSGANIYRCPAWTSSAIPGSCSVERIQRGAKWTEFCNPETRFSDLEEETAGGIECELDSRRKVSSSHSKDSLYDIVVLKGPGQSKDSSNEDSYDNDNDEEKDNDKLDTPLSEHLLSSDSLKWSAETFEDRSNTPQSSDSFCSVTVSSLSQRSHLSSSRSPAGPSLVAVPRDSLDSRSVSSTESLDCILSSSLVSSPRDSSTPKSLFGEEFGLIDETPVECDPSLNRNNHNVSDDEDTNDFTGDVFLPGSSRNTIVLERDELGRPVLRNKLRKPTRTKSLSREITSVEKMRHIDTDSHPKLSSYYQSTHFEAIIGALTPATLLNQTWHPPHEYCLLQIKASRPRKNDTCRVTTIESSNATETSRDICCKMAEVNSKFCLSGNVKRSVASGIEYVYELRSADDLGFIKSISQPYSLETYFCREHAKCLFRRIKCEPLRSVREEGQSDKLPREESRLERHKVKAHHVFRLPVNRNVDIISRPYVEEPNLLKNFSPWNDRGGNVNNNSSWDLEDLDLDTDIETLNSASSNSTIRQSRRPSELFHASSDKLAGMSLNKLTGTPSDKPTVPSSGKLVDPSAGQSAVTSSINPESGPLFLQRSNRSCDLLSDSSNSGELDQKGNHSSKRLDHAKGEVETKTVKEGGLLQQVGSFDSSNKKSPTSAWVDSVYSLEDEILTSNTGKQNQPTTKKSVTFKLRSQAAAARTNMNSPRLGESASLGQLEHYPAQSGHHFQDDDDLETTLLDVDVTKKSSKTKETTTRRMSTEQVLCQSKPLQQTLSRRAAFEAKIDQCLLESPDPEDNVPDKTSQQSLGAAGVEDKFSLSSAASDELSYEDVSSNRRTKSPTESHYPDLKRVSNKPIDSSPDPRDTSNQERMQPKVASIPGNSLVQPIPSSSRAIKISRNRKTSSQGKPSRRPSVTQSAPIRGKDIRKLSNDQVQPRPGQTPQIRDLRAQSCDERLKLDVPVDESLVSNLFKDSPNFGAEFENPNYTSRADTYENSPSDSTSEDKNSPGKTSLRVAKLLQMVGFIGRKKHKVDKSDHSKNKTTNKGRQFEQPQTQNICSDTTDESAHLATWKNSSQSDKQINNQVEMTTGEDYAELEVSPNTKTSSAKRRSISRMKWWTRLPKHPSFEENKEQADNIQLSEEFESRIEFKNNCKSREVMNSHSIVEDGDRISSQKIPVYRNKQRLETLKFTDESFYRKSKERQGNMNQSKHDPETNTFVESQNTLEEAKDKKGCQKRKRFFQFSREDNLNENKPSKKKTGRSRTVSTHQRETTRGAPAGGPREGPRKQAGTSHGGKHPNKTHKSRLARRHNRSSGPGSSVKVVTFKDEFRALEKYKLKLLASLTFETAFRHPDLNRYGEDLPPDHSRVNVEMTGPGDSDYYNASYLDLGSDIEYIAAQSPFSAFTVSDFWRMVLQNDVETIVMMTNCVEWGQVKCVQYWADHGVFADGPVLVETVEQQVFADFIVRTLKVTSSSSLDVQVTHFQFQSWPARGVPDDPVPLLELRYRVRRSHGGKTSPVLVHCETGGRQTAVFIAVDQLIEQYGRHGSVNVYGFVRKMRKSRPEMVRSLKQYRFIYECLFEEFQAGNTSLGLDLERKLKAKSNKNPQTGFSFLMDEFRMLCTFTPAIHPSACAAGLLRENSTKNVDRSIIPPDFYRPYVHIPGNPMTHGYINAVFVDGLRQAREFLVTQIPLSHTVFMFWRMVYDHQVQTIVMLGSVDRPNQARYIPQTGSRKFEYLMVELINVSSQGPVTVRNLKLWVHTMAGVEKRAIRHFEVAGWVEADRTWNSKESNLNLKPADVLEVLDLVMDWQTVSNRKTRSIVVCCSNGATRCGLFCACAVLCERLREDTEVDLYHTVKHMKRRRPQFISDFDQYRFLHLVLLEDIRTHEDTEEQTALDGGEDTLSFHDEMDSQIVSIEHSAPSALKPTKEQKFGQRWRKHDDTSQQVDHVEEGGQTSCADCIQLTTGDSPCQCVCECDCDESPQDRSPRPTRHVTLRSGMSTPCQRQGGHQTPRGDSWNLQCTDPTSGQDELAERSDEEELTVCQRSQLLTRQPSRRQHWQDPIEETRPITPGPRQQRPPQTSTPASRQGADEISACCNQMDAEREDRFRHRQEDSPYLRHGNPSWKEDCFNQRHERLICQADHLIQRQENPFNSHFSNRRQQQTSWRDECKNGPQDRRKDESSLLEYCKSRLQEKPSLHEDCEIRRKDRANWRDDCMNIRPNMPVLQDNSAVLQGKRDLRKECEAFRQQNSEWREDCEKRRQVKSSWQEDCQSGTQGTPNRRPIVNSSLQDCLNKCEAGMRQPKDRPIEVSSRVPERRIGRLNTSDRSQANQQELQESQTRLEDEKHQPGPSRPREDDNCPPRDNITRIPPGRVTASSFDDSSCSEFDVSLNLL